MARLLAVLLSLAAFGQIKPFPPAGVAVSGSDRAALKTLLDQKRSKFALHPDLAMRIKAVDWALRYNEFFKPEDVAKARQILDENFGEPGLVVHAYKSRIDDSLQPYGVVLPRSWSKNARGKWRVDVWLHGRSDTLSEVNFIHEHLTKPGQFTPPDTIVVHPYGRYCNAFKFAGETDVWEVIESVQKHYRVDPDRIAIRGFSMGGAGTWHLAAHHPGEWAAAAPGAGFVDTEEYQKLREKNGLPEPWVQKLWTMTNAKEYALNFFNLPVIAYSGGDDPQKAAADIMAREMQKSGLALAHIIGPNTGHKYEPKAKELLERDFDRLMDRGRQPQQRVRFATYTTRTNHSHWVLVHELKRHWDRAEVDAAIVDGGITATTKNVNRIEFFFGPGQSPFPAGQAVKITLDGKAFTGPAPGTDLSWKWHSPGAEAEIYKRHNLSGPIDDAFFERFIMVRPAENAPEWAKNEFDRAVQQWRAVFRGDAIVKDESAVTESDIATVNLVLWGTPQTSKLMAKWPAPIPWPQPADQMLIAIYPNPESKRYIVLNSGFTFREAHHGTNSQQTPKLPDWAIVDTSVLPNAERPGRIVNAGFFDESWKLTEPKRSK